MIKCVATREDGAKHFHQEGDGYSFRDGYCFGWHYGSHHYDCCLSSKCKNNKPEKSCDLEGANEYRN